MPASQQYELLAERLVAAELRERNPSDTKARAAFRVWEKLRRHLSVLSGNVAVCALLSRALTLAKGETPWLVRLGMNSEGSLTVPPEMATQLGRNEAAAGAIALIAHILKLLVTFIGEALTLRLVHDVWPKAALKKSPTGEDSV